MVQENNRGAGGGKPSACSAERSAGHDANNDVRQKTAAAVFLSTMVERTVNHFGAVMHSGARDWCLPRHKGQITIGTFVTSKCVLGGVLQHRPSDAFHSRVDPGAAAVRHVQELLDEPTAAPTTGRVRRTCRASQRHHFRRVTFQYEGSETRVLYNFSLKLKVGKTIAIVGRAAPARARCSI